MSNDVKNKDKKSLPTKEDMEKFSNEILNKIQSAQNSTKKKSNGPRSFVLKFNPLVLIISVLVILLLLFSIASRSSDSAVNTSLDNIIRGVKDNQYSRVYIQNDGKVIAYGKTYSILSSGKDVQIQQGTYKFSDDATEGFEVQTLDQFVSSLKVRDPIAVLRATLNSQSSINRVIVGENFIVGIKPTGSKDIIVKNVTEQEFKNALENENLSVETLLVPVEKLRTEGAEVNANSFTERKNDNQFSNILSVNGVLIGKSKPAFIQSFYVDWNPNIYSFTDLLQSEGVSLTNNTVEILSVNVPAGIAFADILNLVVLLGFVGLIFFIFRGAQGSGMGIMQFGQSKAKVFFGSKTETTFEDVAGIDEARNELFEIVDFLKNPNKYRKLGARIPKGILLVGPPGTGKTLLARTIAGEAKVPFFHTSGSEFEEMLVGAGASRVRDLFDKAKKASPALIFIDEIDAVARKRGTKIQSGATEQTLNQILVEMDGFEKNTNVIVLAATNRPDVLDPAILRPGRFDRQVRIELPDVEGRKKILEIHGHNKPFAKDVDLYRIAKRTVGFTGADLENILNESAIIAANANKQEISNADIDEAVSKVVLGPAKKSRKRTDNEMKLVAYHEAGHAVVAKYTPNSTPVDRISIVSRGMTGGVTMFLPENDEYIISKGKLIADITVGLGGRAAEEVALDDISTGASNDIERATAIARRMVQRFGMSDKLGMVQYGDFEENEYLGYAYSSSKEYSEKTAEEIDTEVRSIIESAYKNAKQILVDHRDKLDQVSNILLEKEVMSKDEFDGLFKDIESNGESA
jgi:cell division protease FtsH